MTINEILSAFKSIPASKRNLPIEFVNKDGAFSFKYLSMRIEKDFKGNEFVCIFTENTQPVDSIKLPINKGIFITSLFTRKEIV